VKIGFFVSEASVRRGFESNASAHVQIPLHSMKLLRDAGHELQLITTETGPNEILPRCMPAGIPVHQVVDARRKHNGRSRVRPLKLLRKLWQIRAIIRRERFDIVHFHGSCKLPELAAVVSFLGVSTCFVATVNDADLPARFWSLRRYLWKRIPMFLTSTEFVRDQLRARGIHAQLIKHGTVRDLKAELGSPSLRQPHRVLFWRDPSFTNGADICLAAFSELAPKFPDISFDAAVRDDHWEDWTPRLKELAAQRPNVHVHIFPYTGGISLAQLLAESICVLLPFRVLSYHPQLSVLESIQYGTAVVTSALDSNVDLADAGRNALLVPVGDVAATIAAIERILKNPDWALEFGRRSAANARAVWNWDRYVTQLIAQYSAAGAQAAPGVSQVRRV
jgi:glycosyltransferase involved in cell wall biosynthesis